jgi:hypothetical protein
MPKFHNALHKFASSLNKVILHKESNKRPGKPELLNFEERKKHLELNLYHTSYQELVSSASELDSIKDESNADIIFQIKSKLQKLKQEYEKNNLANLTTISAELLDLDSQLNYPALSEPASFRLPKLPKEISDDMLADVKELEKCFNAAAYRASVILCGRLLETALHRKFYDATKQDILEKSPGIGLGNLVARMKELNIPLDPAISQQIHLINQVRIYSVHTKKDAFYPTKDQTHAIILYTLDIIRKLFS